MPPLPLVPRPEGGWQVGVGPGAVVLRTADEGGEPETGRLLAPSLAGVGLGTAVRGTSEVAPECPVVGAGPLAARLREALGGSEDEAGAPVHVIVHRHAVPPEVGAALARASRAVVPVVVQPWRVVVGPVTGGPDLPCLHCLDLHRRDRDPAWPVVASALGHPVEQVARAAVPEALATAAEGLTVLLVGTVLAGRPVSPGLCHELGTGAPHVVARRWRVHPTCPWHR